MKCTSAVFKVWKKVWLPETSLERGFFSQSKDATAVLRILSVYVLFRKSRKHFVCMKAHNFKRSIDSLVFYFYNRNVVRFRLYNMASFR